MSVVAYRVIHLVATGVLPLIDAPSLAAVFFYVMQADTLRNQLNQTMEDFRTKETDRDAQKKQLTSVIEGLLRKVHCGFVATTLLIFCGMRVLRRINKEVAFFRPPRCSPVL